MLRWRRRVLRFRRGKVKQEKHDVHFHHCTFCYHLIPGELKLREGGKKSEMIIEDNQILIDAKGIKKRKGNKFFPSYTSISRNIQPLKTSERPNWREQRILTKVESF